MIEVDFTHRVQKICAIWIVIWSISPPLQYGTAFRMISIFAAVMWLFIVAYESFYNRERTSLLITFVGLYAIFSVLLKALSGQGLTEAITSSLHILIFCLTMCISCYYIDRDEDFLKVLAFIAVAGLCIWTIITLWEYQINPGVSRLLSHASDVSESYARRGVGGYGLVYPMVFVLLSMLLFTLNKKRFKERTFGIVVIALSVLLIFESGYFIANIMLVTIVIAVLLRLHKKEQIPSTIFILILIVAVCYAILNIIIANEEFILSLFNGSFGSFYATKLQEIINYLKEDEVDGKLLGRTTKYMQTLTAIGKHFFFGAYFANEPDIVGGHSTFLDTLALYGAMFSWPWYSAIWFEFKVLFERIKPFGSVFILLAILIMNGVFNTYVATTGVAAFIVVPGILLTIDNGVQIDENSTNKWDI